VLQAAPVALLVPMAADRRATPKAATEWRQDRLLWQAEFILLLLCTEYGFRHAVDHATGGAFALRRLGWRRRKTVRRRKKWGTICRRWLRWRFFVLAADEAAEGHNAF
jgi:hypothetical protein